MQEEEVTEEGSRGFGYVMNRFRWEKSGEEDSGG